MDNRKQFRSDLDETFMIGSDTYFTSILPESNYGVAFEDDLESGHFYAFRAEGEGVILDALHIYNVRDVIFKDKPSKLNILWTEDALIASLLINDYCHAVFDFTNRSGYCRNASPENVGEWRQTDGRLLTDELILKIFK